MGSSLNIWVVLFTCGIVMALFMSVLFLISPKKYSVHVQNVTAILLVLALLLFLELAEETNLVDSYPFLLGISPTVDLLIWPFFVFYIQSISGKRNAYNLLDMAYFSPFILALIWQVPFFMLSKGEKLSFFHQGVPREVFLLVNFKLICTAGFIAYMIQVQSSAIGRYVFIFRTMKKVKFLKRTRQFVIGISALVLTIYALFYVGYFGVHDIGDSDRIGSLIISVMIYLLAALIFQNPHLITRESYSKQIVESLKGLESKYITRLFQLFDEQRLYLNEKLTVSDIARALDINDQQVSYLVNRQLGISFLDFVNAYRVHDVIGKITNGEHQQKTLLGIGLEAGFNSKASFNRNFKEHTGYTPSDYVAKLKDVSNQN